MFVLDPLYVVAIHEAAHAVVSYRTRGRAKEANIIPRHDALGLTYGSFYNLDHPEIAEPLILELYAGEYAQTRVRSSVGDSGCNRDQKEALDLLFQHYWETREEEFRERSRALVEQHWTEIVAVAEELLKARRLDFVEVELIADIAAGNAGATPEHLRNYRNRPPE